MISFKQLGSLGRLGNQLFQYAALRSLSLEKNCSVGIPTGNEWHSQKCLLTNFNIPREFFYTELYRTKPSKWSEKDAQVFDQTFFTDVLDGDDITGFFQNTKYFLKHEDVIKKELQPKKEWLTKAEIHLNDIKFKAKFHDFDEPEIVSIHVRRGDVVDQTIDLNLYGSDRNSFDPNSIFYQYLQKAMEFFKNKNIVYLVFTGGSRVNDINPDMEWCKNHIIGKNIFYCEGNDAMLDFAIMSKCDHNINCHATTFGWWASYLNENTNKLVIAPERYFVTDRNKIIDGFYPNDFITIKDL